MKLRLGPQRGSLRPSLRSLFWLPIAFFAAQPQVGRAEVVTATICTVQAFNCPVIDTVATGVRSNGVNLLGANKYAIMPFAFTSPVINFTGKVMVTDIAGKFIYSWGTGTASSSILGLSDYLDVTISQTYVTRPGLWGFSELNSGTCNLNAGLAASTSLVQGSVNGALLPVLGVPGDCAIAPFVYGSGPFAKTVGARTNMTAAAQFYFSPAGGLVPQAITLPWGTDFPNPTLPLDNPGGFVTPTDIPLGLQSVPEPGALGFVGGLATMIVAAWRRNRASQLAS